MSLIVPGYDFSAAEVPNHAKFVLQVTGLTVTDIDTTRLNADLLGRSVVVADDTNATLAASVGALWLDADGTLWGRNNNGLVAVRRANGGWETNRTLWNSTAGPAIRPAGMPVEIIPQAGDHRTTVHQIRPQRYPRLVFGWLAETMASYAGTFRPRVVCRGLNRIWYRYTDGISSDATAGYFSAWSVPTDPSSPWRPLSARITDGPNPSNVKSWRPQMSAEIFARLAGANATMGSGMSEGYAFVFPTILRSS